MPRPAGTTQHVLIYGPPAAGKLTVARSLAERCGMILLDNHLTFDVALRVFDFGTAEFNDLVERLRVGLMESVAAAGRDAVSTLVSAHPEDRPYVERMRQVANRVGSRLSLVQLRPPLAVLERRVTAESRRGTGKITDAETLRTVVARFDLYSSVEDADLRIDNTELHRPKSPLESQTTLGWQRSTRRTPTDPAFEDSRRLRLPGWDACEVPQMMRCAGVSNLGALLDVQTQQVAGQRVAGRCREW